MRKHSPVYHGPLDAAAALTNRQPSTPGIGLIGQPTEGGNRKSCGEVGPESWRVAAVPKGRGGAEDGNCGKSAPGAVLSRNPSG